MNAYSLAKTGYGNASEQIRTPKGIEFAAFARITRKLRLADQSKTSTFQDLAEALFENRRLWNLLASQVAETDNALPSQLRAQIFYLAEFTNHHTRKVLSKTASSTALVDINVAVMRGLKQQGK